MIIYCHNEAFQPLIQRVKHGRRAIDGSILASSSKRHTLLSCFLVTVSGSPIWSRLEFSIGSRKDSLL